MDKEWVAVICRIYPQGVKYNSKTGEYCKRYILERICGQEEVPITEAQLEEQEGKTKISPGLDAGMAGGAGKQSRGKD